MNFGKEKHKLSILAQFPLYAVRWELKSNVYNQMIPFFIPDVADFFILYFLCMGY